MASFASRIEGAVVFGNDGKIYQTTEPGNRSHDPIYARFPGLRRECEDAPKALTQGYFDANLEFVESGLASQQIWTDHQKQKTDDEREMNRIKRAPDSVRRARDRRATGG